jgi:hypothetical protein
MNILDEHVLRDQRQLLLTWRIPIRHIGYDIGRRGIKDDAIIPLLLQFQRPTFFTLDFGFYKRRLCHERYCIVYMDIEQDQTAQYIRRFLRQKAFGTRTKRMGKVIRLSPERFSVWQLYAEQEIQIDWT